MNRYKEAMEIQDACNLIAVAGILHKTCLDLLHEGKGTMAIRIDPAVVWIVDKIHDLCGRVEGDELTKAYILCIEKRNETETKEGAL